MLDNLEIETSGLIVAKGILDVGRMVKDGDSTQKRGKNPSNSARENKRKQSEFMKKGSYQL